MSAQVPSQRIFDAIGAQLVLSESFGAPPPKVGEDYEIERILGAGGFGLICRATKVSLRRVVALKLFPLGGADDNSVREALREARSLARLEHPGIVAVYAAGESEVIANERFACAFVEMQFVDGQTLRDWVDETRTAAEVLDVLLEAGRALAHAHQSGLLHRDFKPENLMVDGQGHARVIDFGLALAAEQDADPSLARWDDHADALGTRATQTGLVRGTPGYMAPEVSQGRPMAASDQFALAVVIREMLTGRHPFAAPARETRPAPRPVDGEASFSRLRPLLDRAMSPAPADRFASITEFCDALVAELGPDTGPSPNARPWPQIVGAALGIGGLAAAIALGPSWFASEEPDPAVAATPAPSQPEPTSTTAEIEEPTPAAGGTETGASEAPEPEPPPGPAPGCDTLEAWAGTWQVGTKIVWTEFDYQRDWRIELELELEPQQRCAIAVQAKKYPPLIEGELPGEPSESESAAVAVWEDGAWRLPLTMTFPNDGQTYGSEERHELVLVLDRVAEQARLSGSFRRVNEKDYPIRTGMLVAGRGAVPDLLGLRSSELPCAARCRLECAGESAERACREQACVGLEPGASLCRDPSADFEVPFRAIVTRNMLRDGKDPMKEALERNAKEHRERCPVNAQAIAGRWFVGAALPPDYLDSAALELELRAEGCELRGTATDPRDPGTALSCSGYVTGSGTWVVEPSIPSAAFPSPLVLVGVGSDAPALGTDIADPVRKLRARKLD